MWSLITAIPSLISGLFGTVNNVTNAIANERIALINAKTDEERIQSQERINALSARQAVLIAESATSRINIFVRAFMAAPVATVITKLLFWDKVVGSLMGCAGAPAGTCKIFTTDPLDDHQWQIIMIVVGFYFVYEGAMAVTRIAKSK